MKKNVWIVVVLAALLLVAGGAILFYTKENKKEKVIYDFVGTLGEKDGKCLFYQDDKNYYYFTKSQCDIRVYHGGQSLTLKQALDDKVVTLKDIKEKYPYETIQKTEYEHKISDDVIVYYRGYYDNEKKNTNVITIYQDISYYYRMNPIAEAYVLYQGNQMTYKEALNQNVITIDQLKEVFTSVGDTIIEDRLVHKL